MEDVTSCIFVALEKFVDNPVEMQMGKQALVCMKIVDGFVCM